MAETVGLTVAPVEAAMVAGGELLLAATVRNTGDVAARYTLDVAGVPAAWCAIDEPSFALDAGARRRVAVTLRPPGTATPPDGPLRVTVRATVDDDHAAPAVAHVSLALAAPGRLSLELAPVEAEGREAVFHATVVNGSDAPAAVALLVSDDDQASLRVRVEPQGTVLLPAGERVTMVARVLPPFGAARSPAGQPIAYGLTIRGQDVGALDDTSPYLTRRARFVYTPDGTRDRMRRGGAGSTRGRWPMPLLVGAPLLVLALLVVTAVRVASAPPGPHTRPPASGAPAAASLPVIRRFAAHTDPHTGAPVLAWQVSGATTTTLDDAPVAPVASHALALSRTGMRLLRATNSQGTVISVVTLPSPAATPVVLRVPSISSFEVRHDRSGQRYRLVWRARNARHVTLDGRLVSKQGHFFLPLPLESHTYSLVAMNDVGRVLARVRIVVPAVASQSRSYTVTP